ncbi:hypothetical protein Pst134EA_004679 [Puccinia striiformis f. sp. tritici]|uniref:hypothetical protein n=1 Tax=Puccinia striiformis f. sp. tritici TaxID=168172 RepID=UPI002007DB76|nr:hypothetical protein Pst134EA_004679 [Puccinia striiformis f. sp. tritici]KAH9470754.1 hypothetical protein Pst134EA_004679 [Puccinia striiformis f. sp. tritici]
MDRLLHRGKERTRLGVNEFFGPDITAADYFVTYCLYRKSWTWASLFMDLPLEFRSFEMYFLLHYLAGLIPPPSGCGPAQYPFGPSAMAEGSHRSWYGMVSSVNKRLQFRI